MKLKLLPFLVLIGGFAGVVIGSLSPGLTSVLKPFGEIYIRLMEVVVLPYLVSSLVLGLGRLSPATAVTLFRKSWPVYLLLWAVTFVFLAIAASTVPLVSQTTVVDFSNSLPTDRGSPTALVDLLIPDNFFQALSQNYIPSVVLMGVIFGIAIQHSVKPTSLLDVLTIIRNACIRIWGWVIYMAPLGVCALFAESIGSVSLTGFAALSIYVAVVLLSAAVLALWVFPMLLTVFLPLTYREIMSGLREAFVVAIVTSLSVASLPLIQQAAQDFLARVKTSDTTDEQREIIETSLSVSYPLAQIGNFFILVFLVHAAFYYYLPLERQQLIELPFVTLLSGIGSPTSSIAAVTFMADWLGLPGGTTDLYVETMAITRYAQVIASVSAFAFVTTAITFMFYGKVRFNLRALVLTIAVTAVAFTGIWALGRWGGTHAPLHSEVSYRGASLPDYLQALSDANRASNRVDAQPTQSVDAKPDLHAGLDTIDRIETTGILRVGINPNVMPFSYENNKDRIVGYDVELMYRFAQSMNVDLRFVPYTWQNLNEDLKNHRFDIAIGGLYITDGRLSGLTVSDPYFESPLALIVKSEAVDQFKSRSAIAANKNLSLAVFDDPVMIALAKRNFPSAKLTVVDDYSRLDNMENVQAAIWTREQAKALAISLKDYSAVVPEDTASRFLFAYLMPPASPGLASYLNYWMSLSKDNGVLQDMARRWIDPAEIRRRSED
ncbi:Na+/H+-dicarboxylate symporter [Roseibium hamelinense]|uniref:Na+/H+-dicarboxylate symporter n=1 Tax=Roseibium hamelinense TaxID=150831 RepID=A0A562SXZ8_9HYPH|nr:cation:dicarboxylase symporter family transporter [Roseibium hamelinense]TWI86191.1 Na+/H+-dicarboxylate symporter [Roseibium hamelinense]